MFKKARPKWLRNSRNNLMELDGYSKLLKVAFEYQGIQHYQQVDKIFGYKVDLAWQQQRDREKAELCRKFGIVLIVIPWYVKSLRRFIRAEVRKLGLVGDIAT